MKSGVIWVPVKRGARRVELFFVLGLSGAERGSYIAGEPADGPLRRILRVRAGTGGRVHAQEGRHNGLQGNYASGGPVL